MPSDVLFDVTDSQQARLLLARYELLAHHSRDIMLFIRADGHILDANQAALDAYGYDRATLLGMSVYDLRDPVTANLIEGQMRQADAGDVRFESWHRRRDGTVFPVEVSSVGADLDGQRVLLSTIRDISDRKQDEVVERFLADLGERMRVLDDPDELQWLVASRVGEFLGVSRCLFSEIDLNANRISVRRDYHSGVPSFAGDYPASAFSRAGENTARAGRTMIVVDTQTDPRTAEYAEGWYSLHGARAYVSVPLLRDGQLVSSFWVSSETPRVWSAREISLLETIGERAWLMVERLRHARALRTSEQRFRSLVEATSNVIWTADAQGQLREPSQRWSALTGLPATAYEGTAWLAQIHPDDRERCDRIWWDAITRGTLIEFEQRVCRTDGQYHSYLVRAVPVREADGTVREWMGTDIDITERKQAEDALRHSEERYRALVQATAQAVWSTDNTGRALFPAQWWEEVTGQPTDLTAPWHWLTVVHPEDQDHARAAWENALRTLTPFEVEYRVRERSGAYLYLLVRGVPVRETDGSFREWIGTMTDITARKQFEMEREALLAGEKQARLEAEAANRAKDEFLAVASHELRTPLTAILGWASGLRTGKVKATLLPRALEVIEQNARVQAQLVEDILDYSRIIMGKLSLKVAPVDLPAVIQAALDSVRLAAQAKGIHIETQLAEGGAVMGDRDRLQQVVWNLLSNAVKFTPPGGRVTLRLDRVGDVAQLTVSDTGMGIASDFLPYVFDRFRQADSSSTRKYGGLGLGLAIVRHIVELHGGAIEAVSAGEGQGATFIVNLPISPQLPATDGRVAKEAQAPGLVTPETTAAPELVGCRVMVVDDEVDTLDLLTTILSSSGADVRACRSVAEALATLAVWQPEIVVSDIAMPEQDGYRLIEEVRALDVAQGRHTPALALTAYARVEDRVQVLRAGYDLFVPKPVEPDELLVTLARLAAGNTVA